MHESEYGSDGGTARRSYSGAYLRTSVTVHSIEASQEAAPGKKARSVALTLIRFLPFSPVVAVIMFAFILFACLVACNLNSAFFLERSAAVAQLLNSGVTWTESNNPGNVSTKGDVTTYNSDSSANVNLSSHSSSADAVTSNIIDDSVLSDAVL